MTYRSIPPLALLMTSSLFMGCGGDEANCKDGYALDSQGRCQVVDEETSAGTNTAPTAPGVALSPASPREQGDPLVCRVSSESIDVDGDPVSYSIAWTQNAVAVDADQSDTHAGDTISGARLVLGDEWACTVTPSDGTTDGPTGSASATVGSGFTGWGEQKVSLSEADYVLVGEEAGGCLGGAMASAGDLDDDGKMDFIVGDFWWDNPETGVDAGKAYVFLGADLGATRQISIADAAWQFEGETGRLEDDPDCSGELEDSHICGGDWVGHSVSGGMDGDGDGIDDLLIVGYKSDVGGFNRGKIAFFSGGLLGEHGTRSFADAELMLYGEVAGDSMGHSVDWAGDVDGDGIADIVTGAHGHSTTGETSGRTYLILSGKLSDNDELTFPDAADYIWDGEEAGDESGKRNVYVGDIDGDGLADIATVSLLNQENGSGDSATGERRGSGKFYIMLSSDINAIPPGTVMSADDAAYAWVGEEGGDALGYGVDAMGDFDGDGLDDVCAGSRGNGTNADAAGKSYVISATDMPSLGTRDMGEASYGFLGEGQDDWSGMAVSPAGDMDRDGLPDLTIGAMGHSTEDKELVGRGYLFYAQNTEPGVHELSDADHIFEGEYAWDGAGYRTMGAGDLNGDGLPDMLMSAWQGDVPDQPGKVYVLLNP